jgi:alkanesulfonate monooxygenase SsuD/methylene tetrahydromethanopterin reductase-like flavin-dependent oxidoreductase (luciferase family)
MRLGLCLPTFGWSGPTLFRTPNVDAVDAADVLDWARRADDMGFDSLWACDHLMLGNDNAVLEGWTTLAAAGAVTSQVRLGLIHQATFHRPPAIQANMMATLDQLTNGRLIYFPDMGTYAQEHVAYGLDFPEDAEDRVAMMAESVSLIRHLWAATEPVDFTGQYHSLSQAQANPIPIQQPGPPIWFGETHPTQLRVCARMGDGWNSSPVDTTVLRSRLDLLREACCQVGREFDEIEISLEAQVLVARTPADLRRQLRAMAERPGFEGDVLAGGPADGLEAYLSGATDVLPAALTDTWLIGTPEEVTDRMAELRLVGVDHLMLWFADAPETTGVELFMDAVAPRFQPRQTDRQLEESRS